MEQKVKRTLKLEETEQKRKSKGGLRKKQKGRQKQRKYTLTFREEGVCPFDEAVECDCECPVH